MPYWEKFHIDVARTTFWCSTAPSRTGIVGRTLQSNTYRLYAERWAQLRRQRGNECAFPIIDLWYKLITTRVSGLLRVIQKGGHLARSRGCAPPPIRLYVAFVSNWYADSSTIGRSFRYGAWSPPPFAEAQLLFTVASIFRFLDASMKAATAYAAICRAGELAPDDESIQQERERVETWITRLVDDAKLESFPESWTFERRAL
ncbi:hypothetical protein LA080_012393 [Diaporthe eres]|nr:hypothetical protein LA080_012393 [Diaporthe eres]